MTNYPTEPFKDSVQKYPKSEEGGGFLYSWPLLSSLAHVSNRITPWGSSVAYRDKQLREFYVTEPWLAGTIYSVAIRNAAFEWEVEAKSERLENTLTDMLNAAMAGTQLGWLPFVVRWTTDWLTTDNGAFIELIREEGTSERFKKENAPIVAIGHLDSNRCIRTGNPKEPVIYIDKDSNRHKMKWYEVIPTSEMPSPIETMYGVGYSAITRILNLAQITYSIETFMDEKISGRQYKALHFVSGVSKMEIKDVLDRGQEEADNRGQIRFVLPAVLASIDPEKPVTTETIELAAFPDGFDFDEFMRWYIACVALNTGGDYQDLAPLPGGQLAGAGQSEVLHRKSRGKGPAFFMETIQNLFRDYGVIPRPAQFRFVAKDLAEEMEVAQMGKEIMETLSLARRNDIMDSPAIREALRRANAFDDDILDMVEEDLGAGEFRPASANTTAIGLGDTTANEDAERTKEGPINKLFRWFKEDAQSKDNI